MSNTPRFDANEYEKAKALLKELSVASKEEASKEEDLDESAGFVNYEDDLAAPVSSAGKKKVTKKARSTPASMIKASSSSPSLTSPTTRRVPKTKGRLSKNKDEVFDLPDVSDPPDEKPMYLDTSPEFALKINEIERELLETFNKFGIRFTMEAKFKLMFGELTTLFNKCVHSLTAQLTDLARLRKHYEKLLGDQQEEHTTLIKKMRHDQAELVRKLKAQHTKSHKADLKRMKDDLEAAFKEQVQELKKIKRYNDMQVKEIENQMREKFEQEAKQKQLLEIPKDEEFKDQLRRLEEQAVEAMREKTREIRNLRDDLEHSREQISIRKACQHTLEEAIEKIKNDNRTLRSESKGNELKIVEFQTSMASQAELIELLQKKVRDNVRNMTEDRSQLLSQCQEQIISSSKLESDLRNQLKHADAKLEKAKDEFAAAFKTQQQRGRKEQEVAAAELQKTKDKYNGELDSISARVKTLVSKKDEQIKELTKQLSETQKKLIKTERFIQAQQKELGEI